MTASAATRPGGAARRTCWCATGCLVSASGAASDVPPHLPRVRGAVQEPERAALWRELLRLHPLGQRHVHHVVHEHEPCIHVAASCVRGARRRRRQLGVRGAREVQRLFRAAEAARKRARWPDPHPPCDERQGEWQLDAQVRRQELQQLRRVEHGAVHLVPRHLRGALERRQLERADAPAAPRHVGAIVGAGRHGKHVEQNGHGRSTPAGGQRANCSQARTAAALPPRRSAAP